MTEGLPEPLAACTDGAALVDADGTLRAVNDAYVSLHDRARETIRGRAWPPFAPTDERARLREDALAAARDSGDWRGRVPSRRDGDRFYKSVSLSVLDDGDVLCLAREVTDRVEETERLRRRNERLDRFASIISHDLKEPLTIARARLELAQRECDVEHLAKIDEAHERMEELIDDVLTLSREGETVGETERVAVGEAARSAFEMLDVPSATLRVREDAPTIDADPERLRTLFQNLFGNAVEHGSTGKQTATRSADAVGNGSAGEQIQEDGEHASASVTVEVGGLSEAHGFYVADDGPGIPPEERETVFEYGYSASDGTGFGLTIVQSIAGAHGWDLTLTESEAGGARFELRTR